MQCDVMTRCATVDEVHGLTNGPVLAAMSIDGEQYVADLYASCHRLAASVHLYAGYKKERISTICLAISTQYRSVTDRQRDTDGKTSFDSTIRAMRSIVR